MCDRIIPRIMCGGAGTRLWPASREVRPKQFLPLFGIRSTFQDTILRVSDAALFERPIVITNTGRDRNRSRCAAVANAAGFRPGDCGRRGFCADAQQ
jgi:mannose-1-phosphate guanylyltransferase